MQTKSLFSQHYLTRHLPQFPEWKEDPRPILEELRPLWARARQHGDSWNEGQTEVEFVQPVLRLLGWSFIVQTKSRKSGRISRPDYALFASEEARDKAYRYQGQDDLFYQHASAIAEVKYWGRSLDRRDNTGRDTWKTDNPSFQILYYLVGTRVSWGILTNGILWRLYSREVSSTASEFYEVDLGAILDFLPADQEPSPEQLDQFRRWWLFFRRDAFLPDREGKTFVQRVYEGSNTYAKQVSDNLKKLVFEKVMPLIAGGFVSYRYHQKGIREETPETLQQIYEASLSLLYKLLFLFYAEARGLLPTNNAGYYEQSLTALARWAAERLDQHLPISDAVHATPKYGALLDLFRRIDQGDSSLGIPRYNGGLFRPDAPENRFLEGHRLSDRIVAQVVDALARDNKEPVDYAYLNVRNLGSIYEGLLEYRLEVSRAESGEVKLIPDRRERKTTGSYYTPDYIVNYIVQQTLRPILDEREKAFRAAMDRCADLRKRMERTEKPVVARNLRDQLEQAAREAVEAFLGIKVCDPAMGSGHFLVSAVDFLTDGIIQRMQAYHNERTDVPWEWNPISQLIEQVRREVLEEMKRQGVRIDPARLDDAAILKRLVMKRCIYGVDLNRMAVELAKLSLWLHSFTIGAPLSFLDHHLRCGNSLIGASVREVERALQAEGGQLSLFSGPFAGLLGLTALMVEVAERTDATLADVERSAKDFEAFQQAISPYKSVLDLWTSQYFGNRRAYEFLTVHSQDVLPALRGEKGIPSEYEGAIEQAQSLREKKRFFHWELEFPDVFIDLRRRDWAEDPGFDAVIGNPPYVRSVRLKDADPEAWAYYAQAYRAAAKREFDIYLCFVEKGLSLLKACGRFGMILPNKWFTTQVGESLRSLLAERQAVERIVDFGHFQVFPEATTYTCLLFLNGSPQAEATVAVLEEASKGSQPLPEGEGKWREGTVQIAGWGPRVWTFSFGKAKSLLEKWKELPTLESVAVVFQGTGTRADPVFMMTRYENRFYSRSLEDWVEIEEELMRPALTGRDIDPYYYESNNFLLFPYQLIDGEPHLISPEEMKKEYPKAWSYLNNPKNRQWLEERERGSFRNREDWYAYGYPRNMNRLGLKKVVGPDVVVRAEFAYDPEGRYIIDTVYAVLLRKEVQMSPLALTAVLNSPVMTFFLQQTGTKLRGGYFRMKTAYLNPFPIPRISFSTPPDERSRLADEGRALAAGAIHDLRDARHISYSAFLNTPLGRWLQARLDSNPEQSDVIHDVLADLSEQMAQMNKEKHQEIRGFLDWLTREIGAPLEDLKGYVRIRRYAGDYLRGEKELTFGELLDLLRQNRQKLKINPSERRFQETLKEEYAATMEKLLPLQRRLASTHRLIDLIVYCLYKLEEEEVEVIEHSLSLAAKDMEALD